MANLVSHSEYQLAIVVKELLSVLESLNKVSGGKRAALTSNTNTGLDLCSRHRTRLWRMQ